MTELSKLRRLAAEDRADCSTPSCLAGLVRVGFSLLPFLTLQRSLNRLARLPTARLAVNSPPVDRRHWATRAASQRAPKAILLVRSLAGQLFLARHGHSWPVRSPLQFAGFGGSGGSS
jgi:hypothetical protein